MSFDGPIAPARLSERNSPKLCLSNSANSLDLMLDRLAGKSEVRTVRHVVVLYAAPDRARVESTGAHQNTITITDGKSRWVPGQVAHPNSTPQVRSCGKPEEVSRASRCGLSHFILFWNSPLEY
jgi:hypothetical protein